MKKFLWHYIAGICMCLFFSIVFVATAQEGQQSTIIEQPFAYTEYTHPLLIEVMKNISYPGSEIVIETELPKGAGHDRYIASYISDNKKIYAFLAVPRQKQPPQGFPAVILAHGYTPPREYITGELYPDLVNTLAENGYIVFMPDFRGHGNSQGEAEGAYFSPGYTVDFQNAIASLVRYKGVNSEKIGAWGHSMGGNVVLRSLVVNSKIRSASIWAGVVGSYHDILFHWNKATVWNSSTDQAVVRPAQLEDQFGDINKNADFWNKISPLTYLDSVASPVQLLHSVDDPIVPVEFSYKLSGMLNMIGKDVELRTYPGQNHDLIADEHTTAIENTLQFFDSTLRN